MVTENVEDAADFLTKTNFKSFIEWITAESILNRPADPLLFTKKLIDDKLAERSGAKYKPEDATDYVKATYAEASSSTDETGRIKGKGDTSGSAEAGGGGGGNQTHMSKRLELLEKLIDASRSIAMKLDPFEAQTNIITESCRILDADRATLYELDKRTNELVLMTAEGVKDLRLPIGQGIAGTVAETGKKINIKDAYNDDRFDSSHDQETGYKTDTILCAPVLNGELETVGVIQVINRSNGIFTDTDEEVLGILAAQSGIAMQNAKLFHKSQTASRKVQSLLDIIKAMHSDMGINSLMFTITTRAHTLVDADRCTLFMVDRENEELWSMQGEVNIRAPLNKGIAGSVATTGELLNIQDAYKDPRFNQDVDKKSGYRTTTILTMPIFGMQNTNGEKPKVVGVLQVINKAQDVFGTQDIDVMETFLTIAGPILETSKLFQRSKPKAKGRRGTEFPPGGGGGPGKGKTAASPASSGRDLPSMNLAPIGDDDDDGEEDDF